MTKDEWVDVCGHALEAAGIQNFHPLEIADVGRESVTTLHGSHSWYRDSAYNHRIGGVPGSMHLTCGAADVTKAGFTPDEVADILERHPDSDEFGIGRYKTFTHIDIRGRIGRNAPARW